MDNNEKAARGIRERIETKLEAAAIGLGASDVGPDLTERPRDMSHGDFASSLAMRLAKKLKKAPRDIAKKLAKAASDIDGIQEAKVAGPGFVNLVLSPVARCAVVEEVLEQKERFGSWPKSGESFLLEFVSANPTGPLHVGHGRSAAVGDSLARILEFSGAAVSTEYYLNDRGLQIDILAASLWARVLMLRGKLACNMPEGTYAGEYLVDVASRFDRQHPKIKGSPMELGKLGDDQKRFGAIIAGRAKKSLGNDFAVVRSFAVDAMLRLIKDELSSFQVRFDSWRSEADIHEKGMMQKAIDKLTELGHTYEKDGALWFRSSSFGDTKDWVVVRSNGELTYFAADIAYHVEKAQRTRGVIYDLFGADHHGYVPRLRALLEAFGESPARLEAQLVQFVSLVNDKGRVKMSTRKGEFLSLGDLVASVGVSAARLFFVMSRADVPMDFDVAKATAKGQENPVYYMQYAHARSCALLGRWGGDVSSLGKVNPASLDDRDARAVMTELRWFPTTVKTAAKERSPHRVAHWLVALASALHGFYDRVPVLAGDKAGLESRLALVEATRQALANGMGLLGVEAPNKM